jgi:transcriptional regulator with XRE-family HTH domain
VLKEQISPIRAWCEHLDLAQAEVSARMDVSQSAFARVEAAEGKPRMSALKKVAAALELARNNSNGSSFGCPPAKEGDPAYRATKENGDDFGGNTKMSQCILDVISR